MTPLDLDHLSAMAAFMPIVADTLLTMIRRTWTGHSPFVAHCDFYYQRMILAGTPRLRVALLHWIAIALWGCLGLVLS